MDAPLPQWPEMNHAVRVPGTAACRKCGPQPVEAFMPSRPDTCRKCLRIAHRTRHGIKPKLKYRGEVA